MLHFLPRIAGVTLVEAHPEIHVWLSSPHCGGYSMGGFAITAPEKLSSPRCGGYSFDLNLKELTHDFLPRVAGVTPLLC